MNPRDLRDGYDRSAPLYEERFAELQRPKLDAVLGRVAPLLARSGARALDVGCGTGLLAARLAPSVQLVGVDISFEMLRRGRGVRLQGDALALPLRAASFDVAFAITSLLSDRPRALIELHRVLKSGALLAVTLLREEAPRDFEQELRACGFSPSDQFECGQDFGWVAQRI